MFRWFDMTQQTAIVRCYLTRLGAGHAQSASSATVCLKRNCAEPGPDLHVNPHLPQAWTQTHRPRCQLVQTAMRSEQTRYVLQRLSWTEAQRQLSGGRGGPTLAAALPDPRAALLYHRQLGGRRCRFLGHALTTHPQLHVSVLPLVPAPALEQSGVYIVPGQAHRPSIYAHTIGLPGCMHCSHYPQHAFHLARYELNICTDALHNSGTTRKC